jgi:hypothetical protein
MKKVALILKEKKMITGRCQRGDHNLCKKRKCKCKCHSWNKERGIK